MSKEKKQIKDSKKNKNPKKLSKAEMKTKKGGMTVFVTTKPYDPMARPKG